MAAAVEVSAARVPVVLVVPTYNEAAAIGAALSGVPRDVVERIIVADGDSTDATAQAARAAGAEVLSAGRGYGRACWAGAQAAAPDAILVFMDGDGSDRAEFIPELIAPLVAGTHDFVIASRVRGTREPGSMGLHQILIGVVIGFLIKLRFGTGYTDMCAFRAIRRERLLALGMREMTYGWNLEMQVRAVRCKLRILELPVSYGRRRGGASKVSGNVMTSIRVGGRLLWTFLRLAAIDSRA
jgi:glycosyltransferase involved in cell wall biosynthesis